jgi:hypothetical protein
VRHPSQTRGLRSKLHLACLRLGTPRLFSC